MTREICKACWRPSPVGFSVPDEVWRRVKPERLPGDVLCITCFAALADEAMIAWDAEIQFFPVSLATLHDRRRATDHDAQSLVALRDQYAERVKTAVYEQTEAWLTPHVTHDVLKVVREGESAEVWQRFACLDCRKELSVSVMWPDPWGRPPGSALSIEPSEREMSEAEVRALRSVEAEPAV